MPLIAANLSSQLQSLFENPPATYAAAAQAWSDAIQAYAAAVIPASTTAPAAAATLSGALTGAFSAPPSAAAMESAFTAFGATLGAGMAGYAAVPPAAPVGFATLFNTHPSDHATAATGIANAIDVWMRTGTAALISPPGLPTPWS